MIKFFKLIILLNLFLIGSSKAQSKKHKQQEVYNEMIKANLQHPKIVLKQAIHESGNFKSKAALTKNNILGIMNNAGTKPRYFESIEDCIYFYKARIQSRYKGGDYYKFLKRIGYAADVRYKSKVENTPLFIIE